MAKLTPRKIVLEEINNGNEYIDGVDSPSASSINRSMEASAYAQNIADSAKTTADNAVDTADDVKARADNGDFNGADGKGIVSITNGETRVEGGYTITPQTVLYSDGSSNTFDVYANKGDSGINSALVKNELDKDDSENTLSMKAMSEEFESLLNEYDNTDTYNTRITGGYPNELQGGSFAYVERIEGNSVEQVLSNGDFSNGIIGWQSSSVANYSLSIDVSTSEAIVVPALGKTPTSGGLFQNIQNKNISNKTLFTIVKLGNVEYNNAQTSFYAQVRLESVEIGGNVSKNFNETQSNDILFAKLNHTNYTTKALVVSTSVTSGELLTEMRVKQIMLFDITNLPSTLTDEEIYNLLKDIPYTEGEINTVFSGVEQTGKNLINIEDYEDVINNFYYKDRKFELNAVSKILPKSCVLSFDLRILSGSTPEAHSNYQIYDINNNIVSSYYGDSYRSYTAGDVVHKELPLELLSSSYFINLRGLSSKVPHTYTYVVENVQISLSTTDQTYEPYKTSQWNLPSVVELRSSNEYLESVEQVLSNGDFVDTSGWIATGGGTLSVASNIATATFQTNQYTAVGFSGKSNMPSVTSQTSFIIYDVETSIDTELFYYVRYGATIYSSNKKKYTSWQPVYLKLPSSGADNTFMIGVNVPVGAYNDFNVKVRNVRLFDISDSILATMTDDEIYNQLSSKTYYEGVQEISLQGDLVQDELDITNEKIIKRVDDNGYVLDNPIETPYAITDKSYIILSNNGTETQTLTQSSMPATITAKYNRDTKLQVNENAKDLAQIQNAILQKQGKCIVSKVILSPALTSISVGNLFENATENDYFRLTFSLAKTVPTGMVAIDFDLVFNYSNSPKAYYQRVVENNQDYLVSMHAFNIQSYPTVLLLNYTEGDLGILTNNEVTVVLQKLT